MHGWVQIFIILFSSIICPSNFYRYWEYLKSSYVVAHVTWPLLQITIQKSTFDVLASYWNFLLIYHNHYCSHTDSLSSIKHSHSHVSFPIDVAKSMPMKYQGWKFYRWQFDHNNHENDIPQNFYIYDTF